MSSRSTPRQYRQTRSRMAARSASSLVIEASVTVRCGPCGLVFSGPAQVNYQALAWFGNPLSANGSGGACGGSGDAMAQLGFNLMAVDELYGGRFAGILDAATLADRMGV